MIRYKADAVEFKFTYIFILMYDLFSDCQEKRSEIGCKRVGGALR